MIRIKKKVVPKEYVKSLLVLRNLPHVPNSRLRKYMRRKVR